MALNHKWFCLPEDNWQYIHGDLLGIITQGWMLLGTRILVNFLTKKDCPYNKEFTRPKDQWCQDWATLAGLLEAQSSYLCACGHLLTLPHPGPLISLRLSLLQMRQNSPKEKKDTLYINNYRHFWSKISYYPEAHQGLWLNYYM